MPLQIFTEDQLNEAYEILARKALGLSIEKFDRSEVRASIVDINDYTSAANLLNLVTRSHRAGYDCIIFIMDAESPPFSADRPDKLRDFRDAFRQLCDYLRDLAKNDPLRKINVISIVIQSCLESWLASDPQAIVDAVRGRRGVRYRPDTRNTENLTPRQAAEYISQVIRQVGRETGKRSLLKASASNIKRRGQVIARFVDPNRSRQFNRSLDYFFEMVSCQHHGCDQPFPV